jgi:uncharacterized membrane protein YcjF (UPF0283 family)
MNEQSDYGRYGMAAICVLAGAAIVALAIGVIPSDEAKFRAPQWVVGCAGGVFMLAGIMIMLPPTIVRVQNFLGAVLMSMFASIFCWVGFGPGPRTFSGSASIGGFATNTAPDASTGRIVFGAAGVLIGLCAAYMWVKWLRTLFAKTDDDAG